VLPCLLLHKFASAIILTCALGKHFWSHLSVAPKVFERVERAFGQTCHLLLRDVQQQAPKIGGALGDASALADNLADGVIAASPSQPPDGSLVTELQNSLYDELPIFADVLLVCIHIPKSNGAALSVKRCASLAFLLSKSVGDG